MQGGPPIGRPDEGRHNVEDVFTGIVEELGRVDARTADRLRLTCTTVLDDVELGASIAVNGCCLTVVAWGDRLVGGRRQRRDAGSARASATCSPAIRSTWSARCGSSTASAGTSSRATSTASARSSTYPQTCECAAIRELLRYVVEKGSITVDGISLTVVDPLDDGFTVASSRTPPTSRRSATRAQAPASTSKST